MVGVVRHCEYVPAFHPQPYGLTDAEIHIVSWEEAELGRLECRKDLPFRAEWNGRWYATKEVRAMFVDEPEEIVVITVYTYYH